MLKLLDKHKGIAAVTIEQRKTRKKRSKEEQTLQEWAAEYFKLCLIDGIAKYEGHESSIGIGVMPPKATDSMITKKCKNFYNCFVIPAQKRFQAKGVTKGSPDGFLFYKGGMVCIEYKIGKNNASYEQVEYARQMMALGMPTEYPRTQEDVVALPGKYGIKTRAHGGLI